jgi:hypothetical protein
MRASNSGERKRTAALTETAAAQKAIQTIASLLAAAYAKYRKQEQALVFPPPPGVPALDNPAAESVHGVS